MQNVKYIRSFVTGYIKNIKRRNSRTKKNKHYYVPDFLWYGMVGTVIVVVKF